MRPRFFRILDRRSMAKRLRAITMSSRQRGAILSVTCRWQRNMKLTRQQRKITRLIRAFQKFKRRKRNKWMTLSSSATKRLTQSKKTITAKGQTQMATRRSFILETRPCQCKTQHCLKSEVATNHRKIAIAYLQSKRALRRENNYLTTSWIKTLTTSKRKIKDAPDASRSRKRAKPNIPLVKMMRRVTTVAKLK